MRKLTWFEPGEKLEKTDVLRAEEILGVALPRDYVRVVSQNAGASNPDECEFVLEIDNEEDICNFGSLLSLREADSETVMAAKADLSDQLPSGVVPVISTGSGDYVCLDFRQGTNPNVVYFAHERAGESSLVHLASTFSDFLELLRVPSDE